MLSVIFSFILGMMVNDLLEGRRLNRKYPGIGFREKQKKDIKNFVVVLFVVLYLLWRGL